MARRGTAGHGVARRGSSVQAGSVNVDGLGVGDVGDIVLQDRRILAHEGIVLPVVAIKRDTCQMVAEPEIYSRGFVHVDESEEMLGAKGSLSLRKEALKDYVLWPLLTGPLFLSTLAANFTANVVRNVWAFTIIFCGHFPEGGTRLDRSHTSRHIVMSAVE